MGEITEVGAQAGGWKVGDLVSAGNPRPVEGIYHQWGGHASHHVYNAENPVLLPVGAAPLDYVVAELGTISFRGVMAASPQRGGTAAVIGQGLIGARPQNRDLAHSDRLDRRFCDSRRCDLATARASSAIAGT